MSCLLYCLVVWRLHLHIRIFPLLERVQRRVTKFILNNFHSDYKPRLLTLGLLPLSMVLELDIAFFNFLNPFSTFLHHLISLMNMSVFLPPPLTHPPNLSSGTSSRLKFPHITSTLIGYHFFGITFQLDI